MGQDHTAVLEGGGGARTNPTKGGAGKKSKQVTDGKGGEGGREGGVTDRVVPLQQRRAGVGV